MASSTNIATSKKIEASTNETASTAIEELTNITASTNKAASTIIVDSTNKAASTNMAASPNMAASTAIEESTNITASTNMTETEDQQLVMEETQTYKENGNHFNYNDEDKNTNPSLTFEDKKQNIYKNKDGKYKTICNKDGEEKGVTQTKKFKKQVEKGEEIQEEKIERTEGKGEREQGKELRKGEIQKEEITVEDKSEKEKNTNEEENDGIQNAEQEGKEEATNEKVYEAVSTGNIESVKHFRASNFDFNQEVKGEKLLHVAAKQGHLEVLTQLLDGGADVNAATRTGKTALYLAIRNDVSTQVVEVLNKHDADWRILDQRGWTALHLAVALGNMSALTIYTQHDYSKLKLAVDKENATLLHYAAANRQKKVSKWLVENGRLSLRVKDKRGYTPDNYASMAGDESLANWLNSNLGYGLLKKLMPCISRPIIDNDALERLMVNNATNCSSSAETNPNSLQTSAGTTVTEDIGVTNTDIQIKTLRDRKSSVDALTETNGAVNTNFSTKRKAVSPPSAMTDDLPQKPIYKNGPAADNETRGAENFGFVMRDDAETLTSPAETLTSPAETLTSPAETLTSPAETLTSPAETLTSPAETLTSPAETLTSPAETLTSPAETLTSPAETLTSPAETLTSPAGTLTSPAGTLTSPAGTLTSPAETLTSPAETLTSPAETLTSPAETLTSPATVDKKTPRILPEEKTLLTTVDDPTLEIKVVVPDTGLSNLGNTCYINSVLQCLYHTRPLTWHFLRREKPKKQVAEAYWTLLQAMVHGHNTKHLLRNLKEVAGNHDELFQDNSQKEAHDFLAHMLEWLHQDLAQKVVNENEGGNEGEGPGLRSIISDSFHGRHRSEILCNTSGKVIVGTTEPFSNLTLSVNPQNTCEIKDLLTHYYREQEITWECENCKMEHLCTQKSVIIGFPRFLLVHLSRVNDNTFSRQKVQVSYPMASLSLGDYSRSSDDRLISSPTYDLYAVCCHQGSMTSGHYTAYCRSDKLSEDSWNFFSDTYVREAKHQEVVSHPDAHILFYEDRDAQDSCIYANNRLYQESSPSERLLQVVS